MVSSHYVNWKHFFLLQIFYMKFLKEKTHTQKNYMKKIYVPIDRNIRDYMENPSIWNIFFPCPTSYWCNRFCVVGIEKLQKDEKFELDFFFLYFTWKYTQSLKKLCIRHTNTTRRSSLLNPFLSFIKKRPVSPASPVNFHKSKKYERMSFYFSKKKKKSNQLSIQA